MVHFLGTQTEVQGKRAFSNDRRWACVLSRFSCVQHCVTLWTAALRVPLPRGLSRQEYWSGLPCRPPGDLPDPGIGPESLKSTCLGTWVLYHQHHLGTPNERLESLFALSLKLYYLVKFGYLVYFLHGISSFPASSSVTHSDWFLITLPSSILFSTSLGNIITKNCHCITTTLLLDWAV